MGGFVEDKRGVSVAGRWISHPFSAVGQALLAGPSLAENGIYSFFSLKGGRMSGSTGSDLLTARPKKHALTAGRVAMSRVERN
jgi:hypothetical protein